MSGSWPVRTWSNFGHLAYDLRLSGMTLPCAVGLRAPTKLDRSLPSPAPKLLAIQRRCIRPSAELEKLSRKLKASTKALWEIEEELRRCEAEGRLGRPVHRVGPVGVEAERQAICAEAADIGAGWREHV